MRSFNRSGRGRVLLAGCDMQRIDTAVDIVLNYLRREVPDLAETVAGRRPTTGHPLAGVTGHRFT